MSWFDLQSKTSWSTTLQTEPNIDQMPKHKIYNLSSQLISLSSTARNQPWCLSCSLYFANLLQTTESQSESGLSLTFSSLLPPSVSSSVSPPLLWCCPAPVPAFFLHHSLFLCSVNILFCISSSHDVHWDCWSHLHCWAGWLQIHCIFQTTPHKHSPLGPTWTQTWKISSSVV